MVELVYCQVFFKYLFILLGMDEANISDDCVKDQHESTTVWKCGPPWAVFHVHAV